MMFVTWKAISHAVHMDSHITWPYQIVSHFVVSQFHFSDNSTFIDPQDARNGLLHGYMIIAWLLCGYMVIYFIDQYIFYLSDNMTF